MKREVRRAQNLTADFTSRSTPTPRRSEADQRQLRPDAVQPLPHRFPKRAPSPSRLRQGMFRSRRASGTSTRVTSILFTAASY